MDNTYLEAVGIQEDDINHIVIARYCPLAMSTVFTTTLSVMVGVYQYYY